MSNHHAVNGATGDLRGRSTEKGLFARQHGGEGVRAMALIDIDALRAYLLDYCGTAAFSGFPAALLDVADIECAAGHELCRIAERLGVDLRRFAVDESEG